MNMYIRPLFIVVLMWAAIFAISISLAKCDTQRRDVLPSITQSCKESVKVFYISKNML